MDNIAFFMSAEETRPWLSAVLSNPDVWCISFRAADRKAGDHSYHDLTATIAASLNLETEIENGLLIYLGHRDLCPGPIWKPIPGEMKHIDFPRSRAIQLIPSLIAQGSILLEGQFAISRAIEYEERGVDRKPLVAWFKTLEKSLRTMRDKNAVLTHFTTLGVVKQLKSVILTPGAVEWKKNGGKLKQSPWIRAVEFDILRKTN